MLAALGFLSAGCPQLLDDDFGPVGDVAAVGGDDTPAGTVGTVGGAVGRGGVGGSASSAGASGSAGSSPAVGAGGAGVAGAGGAGGAAGAGGDASAPSRGGGSGGSACTAPESSGPNGRCYLLVSEVTSWGVARSRCRAHAAGWDLTSIRSAAESEFLASILTVEAWVGADDGNGTELWRWVDDGTEFWDGGASGSATGDAYLNWNPTEPNGGGGPECMRILPTAFWADLDCGTGRGSVCAGPAP